MASESDPNRLNTSLYVGDLHPFVTDINLKTFFNKICPVKNARICRNTSNQESLGYGYVNFKNHEDALNALEHLNYEQIIHRPCRIMWAQRDPNLRRSGKYNLFVKNLGKSVTQKQLYDSCELFGTILSAKIATDEGGNSKGYGFVHFATEEAYTSAMEFLNDYQINDSNKKIFAGPFIPKSERKSLHDPVKFNNCFVKNFNESLDDDSLRTMFEKYGKIISSAVMKDHTGKSKGFGFVCFENPDNAMAACEALNNSEVNGNAIYVGKAIRKEKRLEEVKQKQDKLRQERKTKYSGSVNLYVKNLDPNFDDNDLHDTFAKFGEITSAKVMKGDENKSRGFGFVCFKEADSATRAVSEMRNSVVGNKPLYVAIAQRKEERQNKLLEVFKSKDEEYANMVPNSNYYGNFNQSHLYQGVVMPRPRNINSMMNQMTANPMSQLQFSGPNNAHGHFSHSYNNMRPHNSMNRSGPGIQGMAQGGMNSGISRQPPRGNMQGFGAQHISARPVSNMTQSVRTANPNSNTNVQYNQNARNVAVPPGNDELKTRLGNRLMPTVQRYYPDCAARLTGILLSMDTSSLEILMEDEAALKAQIDEAYSRLRKHDDKNTEAK